jgi:hypothetical protein
MNTARVHARCCPLAGDSWACLVTLCPRRSARSETDPPGPDEFDTSAAPRSASSPLAARRATHLQYGRLRSLGSATGSALITGSKIGPRSCATLIAAAVKSAGTNARARV